MSRPPLRPLYRRALIDTSAYYALADAGDDNHRRARAIRDHLIAQQWRLFTTNFMLAELHALLLVRLGRSTALRVLRTIDRSVTMIIRVRAADEQRARALLEQYDDKDWVSSH